MSVPPACRITIYIRYIGNMYTLMMMRNAIRQIECMSMVRSNTLSIPRNEGASFIRCTSRIYSDEG